MCMMEKREKGGEELLRVGERDEDGEGGVDGGGGEDWEEEMVMERGGRNKGEGRDGNRG